MGYICNDMRVTNLSAKMYHKDTRIYQRSAFTNPFPVSSIESCLKITQGLTITKPQIHICMYNEKEIWFIHDWWLWCLLFVRNFSNTIRSFVIKPLSFPDYVTYKQLLISWDYSQTEACLSSGLVENDHIFYDLFALWRWCDNALLVTMPTSMMITVAKLMHSINKQTDRY